MNKDRSRNWFIEVNPKATCFDTNTDTMEALCVGMGATEYALIKHNKDVEEDGTPKAEHYHIYIEFENARSFKSMQKHFEGAHIEGADSKALCIQYLIHKNHKKKAQYEASAIVSNIANLEGILDISLFEPFYRDNIISYINEGCTTLIHFYKRFGAIINQYRGLIKDLLAEMPKEDAFKAWCWEVPLDIIAPIVYQRLNAQTARLDAELESMDKR